MAFIFSRYVLTRFRFAFSFYTSCDQQQEACNGVLSNKMLNVQSKKKTTTTNLSPIVKKSSLRIIQDFAGTGVDELLRAYPKSLAKIQTSPKCLSILYEPLAEIVASHVYDMFNIRYPMVFEISPGPGILTKAMLKKNIKKLRVFEAQEEFFPALNKLTEKYPNRLELNKTDFLSISKVMSKDLNTGSLDAEEMLGGVEERSWESSPPLVIVGTLPPVIDTKFLTFCLYSLCKYEGFYRKGRVRLLMFVSGKQLSTMLAMPDNHFMIYRASSVLYQTFYDIKILHKEPRVSFFPIVKSRKGDEDYCYDNNYMYLISVTPKLDYGEIVPSREKLHEYAYFVSRHMAKRTAPVVSSLEEFVPTAGPSILKRGISLFTVFGDLSPGEFAAIYKAFSSHPLFRESAYLELASKSGFANYNQLMSE